MWPEYINPNIKDPGKARVACMSPKNEWGILAGTGLLHGLSCMMKRLFHLKTKHKYN